MSNPRPRNTADNSVPLQNILKQTLAAQMMVLVQQGRELVIYEGMITTYDGLVTAYNGVVTRYEGMLDALEQDVIEMRELMERNDRLWWDVHPIDWIVRFCVLGGMVYVFGGKVWEFLVLNAQALAEGVKNFLFWLLRG